MGETRTRRTQHGKLRRRPSSPLRRLRERDNGTLDGLGRAAAGPLRSVRPSRKQPSKDAGSAKLQDGRYRKRYAVAAALLVLGMLMYVLVVSVLRPGAGTHQRPIDADARQATVLAEADGVSISTPIRPASVTGLGYHPDGDSILGMDPRGRNLSANPISRLFMVGSNPEDIRYYEMDPAGRDGPSTGALDVGARAGATVYAPVTGVITAIRPDPMLPNASVIEIKPASDPDLRVYVSLVRDIDPGIGVYSPVTAGKTALGSVPDSARILHPQLSSYTGTAGNHVTISVLRID